MRSAIARRSTAALRDAYDAVRAAMPAARAREADALRRRAGTVPVLDDLSRRPDLGPDGEPAYSNVLVDGMWDNPNYWTRYAFTRAALGLWQGRETGLVGKFNRARVRETFARFGVDTVIDFPRERGRISRFRAEARGLLRDVTTPDDIMRLSLPEEFPAEVFYDGLLTRQRRGTAEPADPMLVDYLAETLANIDTARRIIEAGGYDLVLLSHALNYDFSALAWCAMRRDIPVVVLYGDFGSVRFIRIIKPNDIFFYVNAPTPDEISAAPPVVRAARTEAGSAYLDSRLAGDSGDVGAIFAFRDRAGDIDRNGIAERFGWNPAAPIVCVYGANWFDFPHSVEMTNFRDFQDWIEATLDVARETADVNWLFKAHPCDDWYPSSRGPTLADLVDATAAPNVAVVPKDWNGLALMRAIDAGITYFGTVGIELPSIGTPVMVADSGWYGTHGFVHYPGDRAAYLDALRTPWWKGIDGTEITQRAREFAGWYFAGPDWHCDYVFPDDSEQEAIWESLPGFLERFALQVEREVMGIRDWMASGHRFYQVHKMARDAMEDTPERQRTG
ncbi:MAG: hypothetical protein JJ899_09265 [Alphaproteobacteria bacterium]|nr:hypothetical protein [Alphaproteobacteria bacterium]